MNETSGRIGARSQRITPGLGFCKRCKTTWHFVKPHDTKYNTSSGCFPLCEECWQELKTPEARMPYYKELFAEWAAISPHCLFDWADIEFAVMDGR